MKRLIKTGNKTVIMAIIAAMCLTGCAEEKNRSEESVVQENISGTVQVESTAPDSTEEEKGNETQETVVEEQESDYAGEDADSVLEKLLNNGYEANEYNPYSIGYEDEEGTIHQVKLLTEDGETIGIFSCYPQEAAEGFGTRIHTIVDTFNWDIK